MRAKSASDTLTAGSPAGDPDGHKQITFGSPIDWDPEPLIESVVVHPRADWSYIEAVTEVLKTWAPSNDSLCSGRSSRSGRNSSTHDETAG